MEDKNKHLVCSAEHAGALNTPFRKLGNNPKKILAPFIKEGMQVLDFGCGPGFFTMELAKLVGKNGKVIAADVQTEMLNKVNKKIQNTDLASRIKLHHCASESTGIDDKVDFILAFYVIHEVPNPMSLFSEFKALLNANGSILIVEPWFHVNKKAFTTMMKHLQNEGFIIKAKPRHFFSRSVLISLKS